MTIEEFERMELNRKEKIIPQKLKYKAEDNKTNLHIVYIMVWTKNCGGSKIILEYANRLCQLGHKITIVTYDNLPTWFDLDRKINFIKVKECERIEDYIPICDLIVPTSWKCIYSAVSSYKGTVAYFEQGGAHVFDIETLSARKKQVVSEYIKAVPFIYTVSSYTKDCIKKQFNKGAFVIPNAVNQDVFYFERQRREKEIINITTIGPEEFPFKHIENVIKAVEILEKKYRNIRLNWITQSEPKKHIDGVIVNPTQIQIGDIMRKTDVYICASDYESFALPVLEAMTCGATVLTTDNGGIQDFVKDGINALIIKKNNIVDIVDKVEILIKHKEYKEQITKRAIETSKKFNWENNVKKLEDYYKKIALYSIIK